MQRVTGRWEVWLACAAAAVCSAAASAAIHLELRMEPPTVAVGEVAEVGLYAVSDDEGVQLFAAMDVVVTWDPGQLTFLELDGTGATNLLLSALPANDPYDLNDDTADGEVLYVAFAPLGQRVPATPEGTLVTTFRFEALVPDDMAMVNIPPRGSNGAETVVYDGTIPNFDVTGTLSGVTIEIISDGPSCPADLDLDGAVDVADLLSLLAAWGACDDPCPADLDDDDQVAVGDLLMLLGAWGACQ